MTSNSTASDRHRPAQAASAPEPERRGSLTCGLTGRRCRRRHDAPRCSSAAARSASRPEPEPRCRHAARSQPRRRRPATRCAACAWRCADVRGTARSSGVISGRRARAARSASRSLLLKLDEKLVDGRVGIEPDRQRVRAHERAAEDAAGQPREVVALERLERGRRDLRAPSRCRRSDTPRASRACFSSGAEIRSSGAVLYL